MAVTGVAVLILLAAMASGWMLRALLLRTLRTRHPREFEALGNPSARHLSSMLPRHNEMHVQFWKYLWEGKVFLLKDDLATGLAWAALTSDVTLVASVVLLFWSAWK
ncbi:MAG: hypothetical protein IPP91_12820 [Betaproteobacteria bacterium]|nr:hypothetical protein [Betaproteobacteria bacterium]